MFNLFKNKIFSPKYLTDKEKEIIKKKIIDKWLSRVPVEVEKLLSENKLKYGDVIRLSYEFKIKK